MNSNSAKSLCGAILFAAALIVAGCSSQPVPNTRPPAIPKTWNDEDMRTLEIPLAQAAASPVHVSSDYYYRIPARTIFKTYPVYPPDREPPGYIDQLQQRDPEVAFDASKLKSEEDWIKAGEIVFDAPITVGRLGSLSTESDLYVRDRKWYEATRTPLARDGSLPFYRYVVAEKGKVTVGILACGMCHTRVMPDGRLIKGAQGNFPFDRAMAADYRSGTLKLEDIRLIERFLFTTPLLRTENEARLGRMSIDQMAAAHEAIPSGVLARHRSSVATPLQVPDLIGVKDRRYFDHSGLQLHRSLVDLMRYAALNQGADDLAEFGDFSPMNLLFDGKRPDPSTQTRYSEEQLYALAMYMYSLRPPANPNVLDSVAERGRKVFETEGCGGCHTPPLYTNNQLSPAEGFMVPREHYDRYDIMDISVGTDPNLTLKTRRGTGYYKVPSLKGVWYRGPFSHDGSVATLEDWFDPRRTQPDYVPTGFVGYGITHRAVPGHPFGLKLSRADREALIAFLKTL